MPLVNKHLPWSAFTMVTSLRCASLCFLCLCLVVLIININYSRRVVQRKDKEKRTVHALVYRPPCKEQTKVVFLKVHKTGGTTVSNILQRFGYKRKLNFALPNKPVGELRYNYFGGIGDSLKKSHIIPMSNRYDFDILCHHVIFNDHAFDEIFPRNVTYVTLLRDPVQQFLSALLYYNFNDHLFQIASRNISEYLTDPWKYEDKNPYYSFTNNRQSLDLGFNPNSLGDEELVEEYIYILDDRFDLVMINEYFDESLVMLKRHMCWEIRDILYMRKNLGYRTLDTNLSSYDLDRLKKWQFSDFLIYRHFLKKLLVRMKEEKYLTEEVAHFREISHKMHAFCNSTDMSHVIIEGSPWNEEFTISSFDCALMRLSEVSFLTELRRVRPSGLSILPSVPVK